MTKNRARVSSFVDTDSSLISEVRYHHPSASMYIMFKAGLIYRYADVPVSIYEKFRVAESKGRYFNEAIVRKYIASRRPNGFPKIVHLNKQTITL